MSDHFQDLYNFSRGQWGWTMKEYLAIPPYVLGAVISNIETEDSSNFAEEEVCTL